MAEAKALPDFFDGYKIRVGRNPGDGILRMRTAKRIGIITDDR